MKKSIIVAVSENQVIGRDNDLIWHLPRDLRFFKKTTQGHAMLMGRKTFQSFPKPLPGRRHLVISRNFSYDHPLVFVESDIQDAIEKAERWEEDELFIAGGGKIYEKFLENDWVDKIYLTRIHEKFDGDTFFPTLEKEKWKTINSVYYQRDDKNKYAMTFNTLVKK